MPIQQAGEFAAPLGFQRHSVQGGLVSGGGQFRLVEGGVQHGFEMEVRRRLRCPGPAQKRNAFSQNGLRSAAFESG